MTHQTHAISWRRYLDLMELGTTHPRTDEVRERIVKERDFLAEQLLRALEEFARPHAERIAAAKPSKSDGGNPPVLAFERTHFHDQAHERVMAATKVALHDEDYGYLHAVVKANDGEPSRLYAGSHSGYFNFGIGGILLDLVPPYLTWNLLHLQGLPSPKSAPWADGHLLYSSSLASHDSDEHMVPLWQQLRPLIGAGEGWPDCRDGESVRTCSKALFRTMYMAVAFLMSGQESDYATMCRKTMLEDIRCMIGSIVGHSSL